MSRAFYFKSSQATKTFAEELAKDFSAKKRDKQTAVLGLIGDLGSGKTTFTQGFIKGLGVRKHILSPTFVILKRFHLPENSGFQDVYHIDAYRIKEKELLDLGWHKILGGHNAVIIEWADRVRSVLPQNTIWINFKHGGTENEREIIIN